MEKGTWFRLKTGNDWGVVYLSRSPLSRSVCTVHTANGHRGPGFYTTASSSRRYALTIGEPIRVRLGDGTERDGVVGFCLERMTVGDHGNSYWVTSQVPRVVFDDGTMASMLDVDVQYDPDRDPTAGEIPEEPKWEAIERALEKGDARALRKKEAAKAKLTPEERKLLGIK